MQSNHIDTKQSYRRKAIILTQSNLIDVFKTTLEQAGFHIPSPKFSDDTPECAGQALLPMMHLTALGKLCWCPDDAPDCAGQALLVSR